MLFSDTANLKLKAAFELYNEYYCETLPKELKTISFSEAFEKKMQKLLIFQKKSYFYAINTVAKRVAILILALLVTLTASTFGVKAIGKAVKDFIIETFITHSDTVTSSDVTTSEDTTASNVESSSSATSSTSPSPDASSENISQNNNSDLMSSTVSDVPSEEIKYYELPISSSVVDYITIGDTIYVLLENPNSIMIIDAANGEVLKDESLESNPGEINFIKNDLWVSFPALKQIRIYDKNNFTEKNRYSFQHTVCSFDANNNYIIYACSAQENGVYRYNILSKEEKQIAFYTSNFLGEKIYKDGFSQANTIINDELGLFYIGESQFDACCLWGVDIETLELDCCFKLNTYGCWNYKRQMFLYDDIIYWSDLKFDTNNGLNNIGYYQYGRNGEAGMLYVNNDFVITIEGLFSKESGKKLLDIYIDKSLLNAAITKSGHLMYSDNKFIYIIPNITKTKTDGLPYLK